jgi:hypothetical protein
LSGGRDERRGRGLSDESSGALELVVGGSLDEAYWRLGGRRGRARDRRVSVPNLYLLANRPRRPESIRA